jgi:predicted kinase
VVTLVLPDPSLVLLIGPAGSGKSTFAREHFTRYEVLSSDTFRGLVSNDDADQSATPAAFEVLRLVAARRLERGLLTVVDATAVVPVDRARQLRLAAEHATPAVGIVFDLPVELCIARSTARTDRIVGAEAVRAQHAQLHLGMADLPAEGFAAMHVLRDPEEIAQLRVERAPRRE